MGTLPETSSPEQSRPFLPPTSASPEAEVPSYGFPVPVFDDHPSAYILLPSYPFRRRRRRRCCVCLPALSASSSLIAVFFSILLLVSAMFLLWPSKPELSVVRLHLDRFRIALFPSASMNMSMGLEIKIRNPDFFSVEYSSIVASIFYRRKLLGSVTSAGGLVEARGVSYVDADLHLDGVRVLEDVIYLIGDVSKGSIEFTTVTEIQGWLRLFLLDVPMKGKISCIVHVNPDHQAVSYQDCYPVILADNGKPDPFFFFSSVSFHLAKEWTEYYK